MPAEVQLKIEQLDLALQQLQHVRERLEDSEARFRRMTQECGGILEGLVKLDQHHASTVRALNDRLSDWCDLERKLLDESAHRIQRFEAGVSHDWQELVQQYEEPLEDLRRQASEIKSTFLEAAKSAELSHHLAEDSFAAHAAEMDRRMSEWARRLYAAIVSSASQASGRPLAEFDSTQGRIDTRQAPVEPWSLESIAQLHQELRSSPDNSGGPRPGRDATVDPRRPNPPQPIAGPAPAGTLQGQELRALPAGADTSSDGRATSPRSARAAVVLVASVVIVAALGVGAYTARLRDRLGYLESVTARATERIVAAERQVGEARTASRRQIEEAQESAFKAQAVADVLAAPDLLRFELRGLTAAPGAYAQVLWSRSRGLVVSASRLPPLAEDRTYQLWVLSEHAPISAGLIRRDESGRGSLIVNAPLTYPRLMGLSVSVEDEGGATRPSGRIYLRTPQ